MNNEQIFNLRLIDINAITFKNDIVNEYSAYYFPKNAIKGLIEKV